MSTGGVFTSTGVAGGRWKRILQTTIIYLILFSGAVLVLIPLWWMLRTSVMRPQEVFSYPPKIFPEQFRWQNYVDVFDKAPFLVYIRNTLYVCFMDLIATVISCSMVAFSFARLRWRGRDVLFAVMLATMMLPGAVTLIPRYLLFKELHWLDSYLPLWVPSWFGFPFFIFMLRQFYATIPYDLDDAARIDGCSTLGIWWRIALPQTKPAITAVAIFTFNATWNDFLNPLLYLSSADKLTLALGLMAFRGPHHTDWHWMMASSVIAMTPIILLFFFAQRYFIQGVTFTGVKG
jgi:ABC-type glycerol-3-phosphate transport system permease component